MGVQVVEAMVAESFDAVSLMLLGRKRELEAELVVDRCACGRARFTSVACDGAQGMRRPVCVVHAQRVVPLDGDLLWAEYAAVCGALDSRAVAR